MKNVNGFSRGDWGGRMDTGAASRQSVSMKWPVAAGARSVGIDVTSSPSHERSSNVGSAPDLHASLHAHTREWSGNPAVLGCYAVRPVALRPRLSNGFALDECLARSQRCVTESMHLKDRAGISMELDDRTGDIRADWRGGEIVEQMPIAAGRERDGVSIRDQLDRPRPVEQAQRRGAGRRQIEIACRANRDDLIALGRQSMSHDAEQCGSR